MLHGQYATPGSPLPTTLLRYLRLWEHEQADWSAAAAAAGARGWADVGGGGAVCVLHGLARSMDQANGTAMKLAHWQASTLVCCTRV